MTEVTSTRSPAWCGVRTSEPDASSPGGRIVRTRFTGLWRHPDFMKLWAGEMISRAGSHVSGLALPLLAVVMLEATPFEMGVLGAARALPALLLGLLAGVWVDRVSRRRLLIGADLGRAMLVGLVAALALLGLVRIEHLWMAAFLAGSLAVLFDVAHQAFLPSILDRKDLVEGNTKLEVGGSLVEIVGPGLAGLLIQLVRAPFALLLDAVSFLVSAWLVWRIKAPEVVDRPDQQRRGVRHEVAEGLRAVLANPILRPIAGCAMIWAGCRGMIVALYLPFILDELGIAPVLVGLIFSAGSLGALALAALARRGTGRIGLGPMLVVAATVGSLAHLLAPFAGGGQALAASVLIAAQVLGGGAYIVYSVGERSLRQAMTPDHLLGRVGATLRFISLGAVPIGALLGGLLGEALGLRSTLLLAGLGSLLAPLWLLGASAIRSQHRLPGHTPESQSAHAGSESDWLHTMSTSSDPRRRAQPVRPGGPDERAMSSSRFSLPPRHHAIPDHLPCISGRPPAQRSHGLGPSTASTAFTA